MAQNVISRFRRGPYWKWPKTGSPSQLFYYCIDFLYLVKFKEQKNLVSGCRPSVNLASLNNCHDIVGVHIVIFYVKAGVKL